MGDRMEQFGNIFDMISQWEGMEEREEGEEVQESKREGGRKRVSKGIRELTEKFERREEEGHNRQSDRRCEMGGE